MTQPDPGSPYPGLAAGDQYANPNAAGGGPLGSFAPIGQQVRRDAAGVAHCPNCGGAEFDNGTSVVRALLRLSLIGRLLVKPVRSEPKPRSQVVCSKCGTKSVWDARSQA